MKGQVITALTPQQKMVSVNNRFGNTNIAQQQGTTRVLFDSLELNGSTELRFFENVSSRNYPFTNIGSEGNRLTVGDTFVVQKIYFAVGTLDEDTGAILSVEPFFSLGWEPFMKGEFSFQIANSQVIKQLPTEIFFSELNPTNINQRDSAFGTFTDIVIPPLLEYVLTYRVAPYTAEPIPFRLFCFLEGSAGIISPQTTF
jgi:hypothetical protein